MVQEKETKMREMDEKSMLALLVTLEKNDINIPYSIKSKLSYGYPEGAEIDSFPPLAIACQCLSISAYLSMYQSGGPLSAAGYVLQTDTAISMADGLVRPMAYGSWLMACCIAHLIAIGTVIHTSKAYDPRVYP